MQWNNARVHCLTPSSPCRLMHACTVTLGVSWVFAKYSLLSNCTSLKRQLRYYCRRYISHTPTKSFIWTTLKGIFSMFLFFCAPSGSRFSNGCISAKYCPITNQTSIERYILCLKCSLMLFFFIFDWHSSGLLIVMTWNRNYNARLWGPWKYVMRHKIKVSGVD